MVDSPEICFVYPTDAVANKSFFFPAPASYSWTGHANENCNLFLLNIIEFEGGDLCKFVVNSLSLNIILRLVEGRFVLLVQNL